MTTHQKLINLALRLLGSPRRSWGVKAEQIHALALAAISVAGLDYNDDITHIRRVAENLSREDLINREYF